LVEDSPSDAALLQESLSQSGLGRFAISLAESWAEADAQLSEGPFEVVLLDLSLPDSSGDETILRARARAPHLPVVVLTGLHDEAIALKALRLGVQDYLVKGQTDGRQIARAIRYAIERKREEARLGAFSELGMRLSAAQTARQAADIIVEVTDRLFRWDACKVELYSPEKNQVYQVLIKETIDGRRVELPAPCNYSQPARLTQEVMHLGARLMLDEAPPPLAGATATGGRARPAGSAMFAPIRHGSSAGGVVSIHSHAPNAYSQEDLNVLQSLADQCGGALERIRTQEALAGAKEELARTNTMLERLVRERTARLEETVSELEHFSYSITHDLRAPLRAMQGFAGILLNELCCHCPGDENREWLRRIETSASRMDRLITDALQFSRAGRREMKLEPTDAAALLQGIIQSYPSMQPPKALIGLEGKIPRVLGNVAGLTQCFSNLLNNAVKFVPPGKVPEVRVRAETREAFVRLWFEDNGIGIPKQAQGKLFLMFQRATTGFEGTGVGLALVKKVAERMGGKVGVESEPGKGSRFWLDLRPAP
jgi:signal transduction histidine kinase/DNA-binding response OmpR family regulator